MFRAHRSKSDRSFSWPLLSLFTISLLVLLPVHQAQASWLLRLLTTPPEMLTAAVQPNPERMEQVANLNLVASLTTPRLPRANDRTGSDDEVRLPTSLLGQSSGKDSFRGVIAPAPDVENALIAEDLIGFAILPESAISNGPSESLLIRNASVIDDGVFTNTLVDEGVSKADAARLVELITPHYQLANIGKGTTLELELHRQIPSGEDGRLASLYFRPDSLTRLRITRDDEGEFELDASKRELKKRWVMARGSIKQGNIWEDAKRYNIPKRIVSNMIRAHRHTVNMEKMSNGDQFSVLFEATIDPKNGRIYRSGEILYTAIRYKGKKTGIYWFDNGSKSNWYKGDGGSTRKGATLMRKPVRSGRLSSNYGMRRHPVLKTKKMHWGTDYAAPAGTPIYAAGSGTISYAGWKGGYGRYISIRHNGTYSTAYAHMKGFAKGMKKGKRVSKGQIIGYVGSTGRSTGPHLHYEVIKNGKKINPMGRQVPVPSVLAGSTRSKFNKQKARIDKLVASALTAEQVSLR